MAGLYIHVPFCHAKCWYCDFYSQSSTKLADRYVSALEGEWNIRKNEIPTPTTIYLGGGTPSVLSPVNIGRLGAWLPREVSEFTVEVNPEDVNAEMVKAWCKIGANRFSMGVQSFSDEELKAVGRRHTAARALAAFDILRQSGIEDISLDVIIGLPGQTRRSLNDTLEILMKLRPTHFSAYILGYEQGTRLWTMRKMGRVKEVDDQTEVLMYNDVCQTARRFGYEHYEISNYALPGFRARHNSSYWADEPYLGLGPGAHSLDGATRRFNPSNLVKWLETIESGKAAYEVEKETDIERVNDRIMIALRTSEGLDLDTIPPEYRSEIERNIGYLDATRIERYGSRLVIPEDAWMWSDDTIATLFV